MAVIGVPGVFPSWIQAVVSAPSGISSVALPPPAVWALPTCTPPLSVVTVPAAPNVISPAATFRELNVLVAPTIASRPAPIFVMLLAPSLVMGTLTSRSTSWDPSATLNRADVLFRSRRTAAAETGMIWAVVADSLTVIVGLWNSLSVPPSQSVPPVMFTWKLFQKWLPTLAPPTVPPLMFSTLTDCSLTYPKALAAV